MSIIGSGTYGTVFKYKSGTVRKSMENSNNRLVSIIREIIAYKLLKDVPNIAVLHSIKMNTEATSLILTEYDQPLSNLTFPLPLQQIKSFTYQMINALSYMHNCGLMHRDIKPQNIMVTGDQVHIIDFGLSRYRCFSNNVAYSNDVQSIYYAAPEVIMKRSGHEMIEPYTEKIDIWSLGVVVMLMLGKITDSSDSISFNSLISLTEQRYGPINVDRWSHTRNNRDVHPSKATIIDELDVPDQLRSLLSSLLTYDPKLRISADLAVKHQYFNNLPIIKQPEHKHHRVWHYPKSRLIGNARSAAFEFVYEVAAVADISNTALYHSYILIDRYYTSYSVDTYKLQLVVSVMLYLSTCIYEPIILDIMDFVHLANNSFTYSQFMDCYCLVLKDMDYDVFVPYKSISHAIIKEYTMSPVYCLEQLTKKKMNKYDKYSYV